MAYDPNHNPSNSGQQPWGANGPFPFAQTQQGYGASFSPQQPTPYMNTYNAPIAYSAAVPVSPTGKRQPGQYRPYLLCLFAYPVLCLKMVLLPSLTTFAKEKDRAGWGLIWTMLLGLSVMAGIATYLWGRLPGLTQGIQILSFNRIIPLPLSPGICFLMALAVPLAFLLVVGVMHLVAKKLGGSGTYRAQCYIAQLIGLPLLVALLAVAFVLNLHPAVAGSQRLAYGLVVLAVVLYAFILHTCALMAVQQLRAGKAILVVLVGLVLVVFLIVIAAAMLESDVFGDSNSSHSGGNGGSHSGGNGSSHNGGSSDGIDVDADMGDRGRRSPGIALLCPNCGLRDFVPTLNAQFSGFCPRCGSPIMRV